jgi:hypothetical protein
VCFRATSDTFAPAANVSVSATILAFVIRQPMAPPLAAGQNFNPHRPNDLKPKFKVICFADLAEQTRRSSPEGYVKWAENPFSAHRTRVIQNTIADFG